VGTELLKCYLTFKLQGVTDVNYYVEQSCSVYEGESDENLKYFLSHNLLNT